MATFQIDLEQQGRLLVDTERHAERTRVVLRLDDVPEPCVLHWGVATRSRRWQVPVPSEWPPGSSAADGAAVQTAFRAPADGARPEIRFDAPPEYVGLDFVLFFPASRRWDNNRGRDYRVSLGEGDAAAHGIARDIVEGETGRHSWTLMHRFNLCHDLLDRVPPGDIDGLSLVFVWLRFSGIRQLTWQRNYNTKPRELAHAQDRLTLKLAARFAARPDERPLLRLVMSTVGRGGEGQRVRDEVLNIMHRHHIKEVSGHFMEEWHQKLHNNTTPDDVVICEAYLAFLESNGDRAVFYRTLETRGVTRARLQSYERPIRSEPDFIPHLKDALARDFREFLHILRLLHSGTDLGAALHDARPVLDRSVAGLLDWISAHQADGAVGTDTLAARVTDARRAISERLRSETRPDRVRALVYLDIALEDLLRLSIERRSDASLGLEQVVELVGLALLNLALTEADDEMHACLGFWTRLRSGPRDSWWPLVADAGLERAGRAAAMTLGRWQAQLQPKADALGPAVGVEPWAVAAFSEQVMRGRAAAVLPMLAGRLRGMLRRQFHLPPWQIVSSGSSGGELRIVDTLASIQATRWATPTVVLAMNVGGHEEIPEGVTAVVTPREVDILSHVGIRARNAGVLFATCDDAAEMERLKGLAGRWISIAVDATGGVRIAADETVANRLPARGSAPVTDRRQRRGTIPGGSAPVIGQRDFTPDTVGGKSLNLARLEGKLPSWIHLPPSVAVRFGALEEALDDPRNADHTARHGQLLRELGEVPADDARGRRRVLDSLRSTVRALAAPGALSSALRDRMAEAGLALPDPEAAWSCIKQVWASKWNERAFASREANGLDHGGVAMAVLVQGVVAASYAFVIHTANPLTGARDEVCAEMVLGLGETLVGASPGRAISFTRKKTASLLNLLALPSKSEGLFGGGLIFRSDSSAEDIPGYAGAGLYDSVMLPAPRRVLLDYAEEPLVWDDEFRRRTAAAIAQIGVAVEAALGGAPQDIEGALAGTEWHVLQARPQVGLNRA